MNGTAAYLDRLRKKSIQVKTRRRGVHKGNRRSSAFGASLDFSDFRAYQPGDDVRQIDWNVYGRTQKHYIKRFLDEQDLSVAVYLDGSASMRTLPEKWGLAKGMAASLAYIALAGEDRLSFIAVSLPGAQPVKRKGAVHGAALYREITALSYTGTSGPFSAAAEASVLKNQQLAVLISDGLEPLGDIENLIRKLRGSRQEVWFLQVLSLEETKPLLSGDLKLIDSEDEPAVHVSISPQVSRTYQEAIRQHNRDLEGICRKYGCQFVQVLDDKDLQTVILKDLHQKGLVN